MDQHSDRRIDGTDGRTGLTIDRRGYLKSTGALAGLSLTGAASAGAEPGNSEERSREQRDFAAEFADPSRDVQPKFRWWWPHAKVEHDELVREINEIADAGFGGVEIADVHHSVEEPIDPEQYGWGTEAWTSVVETALRAAKERDVIVDLTIGPSWPAAVPTVTPNSEAAAKELVFGRTTLSGGETYDGPIPDSDVEPASDELDPTLVAVQAARLTGSDGSEWALARDSLVDLTESVEDGSLTWTAPSDGEWALISYWQRGTVQQPEAGPHTSPESYVIDHFSEAGTRAVTNFWEENILTPTIRDLLFDAGGTLFEDSLELEAATVWTPKALAEFEDRMGYSLREYLPLIVNEDDDPAFEFGDGLTSQVRRDYWETLTQLYLENHAELLRDWAHSIGLGLRVQPYGLETDAIAASAVVDVPEGESLGFSNNDDFRCLAGGRDMGGNEILSEEAGAYRGGAYNTTWETVLESLNNHYAAGVNQAVLHGYSYADAPGAQWPGFAAFTPYNGWPGYSASWGSRQPTWEHVPDISGYLSRTQQLLQSATSKVDAAILRQKGYAGTGFGAPWFTDHGVRRGYSYQFLSPALLTGPNATVEDGRLAPDGPAYKVFVVYEDDFTGENTLLVESAERILEFAKDGLAVVVVGDDYHVPGIPQPGENERLNEIMAELLAQPSVTQVSREVDIPVGLEEQNVTPDLEYTETSPVLNVHRAGKRVDYYYLHNPSDEAVSHSVSAVANVPEAVPYELDAWTGEFERIVEYEEGDGRITASVALAPGESTILAIGRRSWYNDRTSVSVHATSSEVADLRAEDGTLVARDTREGTYTMTLSSGRTVETTIEDVPDARQLSSWQLSVEDWRPGDSATETITKHHEFDLDELRPWTEIPELEDVSGVGTYATTVELGEAWTGGHGAYLDLGEVFDTFRVTVNGEQLPPVSQVNPVADVGPHLESGTNTIEVEVATTLNNRMRLARPEIYDIMPRQEYGLLGPVELVPYGEAPVTE
ncbi:MULTISPECIES: glycosyl hydrolase [Natrialbaceae]|uniref:glycosyl hydrolase n=1 Tax=Natrialbaceae TaxID=1644061 RepID=UPI00207D2714|nr:glycosyl hydrolase [Natronococcus sp. CG52]